MSFSKKCTAFALKCVLVFSFGWCTSNARIKKSSNTTEKINSAEKVDISPAKTKVANSHSARAETNSISDKEKNSSNALDKSRGIDKNSQHSTIQDQIHAIFNSRSSSIVVIISEKTDKSKLIGTGCFVSEKGHIITNAYNINDSVKNFVNFYGVEYEADIIGKDMCSNVALLKIKTLPENATCTSLVASDNLANIGTMVVSLSCKLGLNVAPNLGLITGQDTNFFQKVWPTTLLRSNLRLDGGDGGGMVFDLFGNCVGMMTVSLKEISESYILPAAALKRVWNDLLIFGEARYGYIGINTEAVFDKELNRYCLRIASLQKDSPAKNAGLKKGDILLSINDTPMEYGYQLINFSFFSTPGQIIQIRYLRDGKENNVITRVSKKESTEELVNLTAGEK